MPSYTLSVLELEVSFKAQADHERVQAAKELLEERYRELTQHGRRLSKEIHRPAFDISLGRS